MGEKNLWSKVGLVTLLVGLSIWQIWPPKDKLKPGIDLGGGYSALFEIDDSTDKSADLAERVMNILKQRIDPGSTRNLVWRPVGRNRLEIQMPRAGGDNKDRDRYEALRKELLETNISESQIRGALALNSTTDRDARFAEMVKGIKSREKLIDDLKRLDDEYRELKDRRGSKEQSAGTQPAGTRPAAAATTQPAGRELGMVMQERDEAIEKLDKTDLDMASLLDRLQLGSQSQRRREEIKKIKDAYPDLAGKIDQLVDSYDKWSKQKGMLEDPSDLLRLLRGAGVLEFRILATRDPRSSDMLTSTNPEYNERIDKYTTQLQKRGPRAEPGDKYAWFKVAKPEENSILQSGEYVTGDYLGVKYVLAHNTPDMGLLNDKKWSLVGAGAGRDNTGRLAVDFELDTRGGDRFAKMTSENINQPLCIFLDQEAISAATIRSQIANRGQISGNFSPQEVNYLVNTLEAGALPARLKEVPIQERNVGPSLGQTNIHKGLTATAASLSAVVIFMIIYYAYNGAIADIALMMNLIITLGAMSFLGATFTLPGIAGIILTLGMAVDANVLIFERMREELQRGVSAKMAVKLGYERAFSAIFDGNVTTIITAVILIWIGSEEIKGFGLTLTLGLTISMFTALFVTRQYYYVMIPQMLNHDETRRAWLVPSALALFGGLLVALGYAFHRQVGLGEFVGIIGLTGVVLMVTMWIFRYMYKALGHQKANRLPMMKLMSKANIDWMTKYKKFWLLSGSIIGCGLILMAFVNKNDVMDIEFIGGTDVQVQLKPEYKKTTDEQLLQYIAGNKQGTTSVGWLDEAARQLREATVSPAGDLRYTVSTPKKYSLAQMQALLLSDLSRDVERNGVTQEGDAVAVQFDRQKKDKDVYADAGKVRNLIQKDTADYVAKAAGKLAQARVQSVSQSGETAFEIVTTETARTLVAESLMASMRDILEVKHAIEATLVTDTPKAKSSDGIFPISRNADTLADVIGGNAPENIARYKGGLVLVFDNLRPTATTDEITDRMKAMRMQGEESSGWRDFEVIGLDPAGDKVVKGADGKDRHVPVFKKIAIVVVDQTRIYDEDNKAASETWRADVAVPELKMAKEALASSQALQRVTQFAPQVASEAAQKAVIAVILSFIAIAAYLWVRFGSVDFGLAGIIALYHDVLVALAAVLACHYLHATFIGKLLGLSDFKIDLTIIAALLTIVGYSINDSIVIFDRIRENRGRLGQISPTLVNDSINQTLSRTVLTVFTVFLVVLIMYVAGGEGIHGFSFAMLVGCFTGVYSTIAVATPMVIHPRIMWAVTIGLTGLTAAALATWMVDSTVWRIVVIVLALGVSSAVAYWQYTLHKGEQQPVAPTGRQPVPVR